MKEYILKNKNNDLKNIKSEVDKHGEYLIGKDISKGIIIFLII
jgi:hypothetical protein